ncbi:MAG: hypothetical protein Q8Q36_02160 [bacterium]|nr:hypothetical protein [bacterium]
MPQLQEVRTRKARSAAPVAAAEDPWLHVAVRQEVCLLASATYHMLKERQAIYQQSKKLGEILRFNREELYIVRLWETYGTQFESLMGKLGPFKTSAFVEVVVAAKPFEDPRVQKTFVPFCFADDFNAEGKLTIEPYQLCTQWFQRPSANAHALPSTAN